MGKMNWDEFQREMEFLGVGKKEVTATGYVMFADVAPLTEEMFRHNAVCIIDMLLEITIRSKQPLSLLVEVSEEVPTPPIPEGAMFAGVSMLFDMLREFHTGHPMVLGMATSLISIVREKAPGYGTTFEGIASQLLVARQAEALNRSEV